MLKIAASVHFLLLLLTVSIIKAQDPTMAPVALFPHYAVGNEWSTTIYLSVAGRGVDYEFLGISPCRYNVKFYSQNGVLRHELKYSIKSDSPLTESVIKISVPHFNNSDLAYGPVRVDSDCTMSRPVFYGELLFSQKFGKRVNDGTVKAVIGSSATLAPDPQLLDMDMFSYGYAVYNLGPKARVVYVAVYDEQNKTNVVSGKQLFTLAANEQRIFQLTDVVPEMKGRRGLFTLTFSLSPRGNVSHLMHDVHFLMLKFNTTGLFNSATM